MAEAKDFEVALVNKVTRKFVEHCPLEKGFPVKNDFEEKISGWAAKIKERSIQLGNGN